MKTFSIKHQFFREIAEAYTQANLPEWLLHKSFDWFRRDFIFKLKVNESINSDFHTITRLT